MKPRNIVIVFVLITSIFVAFSIHVRPPEMESIEVKVYEAAYLQNVFEDGEITVKVTVKNNSTKPLRVKEATLVSYAIGYKIGEGKKNSFVVKPGKEKSIKFTMQEDWRFVPLFEPEKQQSYDFIADIDLSGSKMEFIHLMPIPKGSFRPSIPRPE